MNTVICQTCLIMLSIYFVLHIAECEHKENDGCKVVVNSHQTM